MTLDFANRIIDKLQQANPEPKIELNFSNAFELLIATILAAQCTDARVNQVTKTFFKEYPSPAAIASENPEIIAEKIKSTGFYLNKTRALVACSKRLESDFGGHVPNTMEALLKLPGVGRKTANVVLGNAFAQPAIIVDTHASRVSNRLGLTSSLKPEEIEKDLAQIIQQDRWTLFSQLVVLHGRYVCKARLPRCKSCVLLDLCPFEDKNLS